MNINVKKDIVIALYSHQEFYPPTLNLIAELSKKFDTIHVLSRNVYNSSWKYPENVKLLVSGKQTTIRDSENANIISKILAFLIFTLNLWKLCFVVKPVYLVLCDPIPSLAYFVIRPFISRHIKIWYHNHDVIEIKNVRVFSISWLACYSEKKMFKYLSIFTLPAEERKSNFELKNFKGKYYFLPNYPRLEYYSTFSAATPPEGEFRVLFQGSIGPNHGIEEIIGFMQQSISGKQIKLVLKGFCSEEYKRDLLSLATSLGVHHFIEFHGVSCYSEVPLLMSKCHVGIAIHKGTDLMNSTLGTSSNKIYEYAAMGLPVILFDNTHFKAHLGKWDWCFFVDKECSSILQIFEQIILNYPALQNSAIKAHRAGLNFEHYVRDLKFTL